MCSKMQKTTLPVMRRELESCLQAVKEHRLDGAIGALGNCLTVPEEYESAIAAILGEYIDSLVIESLDQTDKALDLIESETIRGSILPLDAIAQTRSLSIELDKAPVEPGKIIGIAANLIKAEPQLKPITDLFIWTSDRGERS